MYWGTSEWSADEIAEACGIAKDLKMIAPVVEQPQYNILERRKVEYEFQRLYQRFGLGLTVFSPIKMGLLSGKYNDNPDAPPAGSRFAEGKGDKFVNWANKEWYGNDEWKALIQNVVKLKVSFVIVVDAVLSLSLACPLPPATLATRYERVMADRDMCVCVWLGYCGEARRDAVTAGPGMVPQEPQRYLRDHRSLTAGANCRECGCIEGSGEADARNHGRGRCHCGRGQTGPGKTRLENGVFFWKFVFLLRPFGWRGFNYWAYHIWERTRGSVQKRTNTSCYQLDPCAAASRPHVMERWPRSFTR